MVESVWEKNYKSGRYNRYPYDQVVSFVLSNYGSVPDRKKIRILDLGCGGGNNTKFLCEEGFDAYGIDSSPTSIKLTRQFIEDCGEIEKIKLEDFENLSFTNDFFDCVIDRQSLGHNPSNKLDIIISEILRVLKPGGHYLGFMFNADHPHRSFGKSINNDGDMNDFSNGSFKKSGLVHFFTVEEITRRFESFEIEDIVTQSNRSLKGPIESKYNLETFLVIAKKPVGFDEWGDEK